MCAYMCVRGGLGGIRDLVQHEVWPDMSRPAWSERDQQRAACTAQTRGFLFHLNTVFILVISGVFMTRDPWQAAIFQRAAQRSPCKMTCVRLSSAANIPAPSRLEMLSALPLIEAHRAR